MSGPHSGEIPRGIEILIKKASVDPAFRAVLLEHRAAAADEIGLTLEANEAMMISAVPVGQLDAIIDRTSVPEEHRRAFLGQVAAVMLAAIGAGATGVAGAAGLVVGGAGGGIFPDRPPAPTGIRPDKPDGNADKAPPKTTAELVVEIIARTLGIELPKEPPKGPAPGPAVRVAGAQAKIDAPPNGPRPLGIPRERRLVEDLKAKPEQLAAIRKAVEECFEIKIAYQASRKLKTVGDWIDAVEAALRRKEAAAKRPAVQPQPGTSRGVRPDRPPSSGFGGVRPDLPPGGSFGVRPE
jgi:hypothetical protein